MLSFRLSPCAAAVPCTKRVLEGASHEPRCDDSATSARASGAVLTARDRRSRTWAIVNCPRLPSTTRRGSRVSVLPGAANATPGYGLAGKPSRHVRKSNQDVIIVEPDPGLQLPPTRLM